jgi:alpha-tubulin suppressor-like RCC1 family protein
LSIDSTGTGYTLTASAANVTSGVDTLDVALHFVGIDAGDSFTCGVSDRGHAYCWGANSSGQLGTGNTTPSLRPVPVSGGHTFASVGGGNAFACGLGTDSLAYCWGNNPYGQVGDGTTGTNRLAPVAVSGNYKYLSVRAGTYHACGIRADSSGVCWGYGGNGQMGNGGTTANNTAPVVVSGGYKFAVLDPGWLQTCGVVAGSGVGLCWGAPTYGELGNGVNTGTFNSPVAVSGGYAFSTISAGENHTCGIQTSGLMLCWGYNGNGQLGDNSTTERDAPVLVYGPFLAANTSHSSPTTCAVEARSSMAFCWGSGPLGNGSTASDSIPRAVFGGRTFSTVANATNQVFACGLAGDGAYCWGTNTSGQLGDGTTTTSLIPIRVKGTR